MLYLNISMIFFLFLELYPESCTTECTCYSDSYHLVAQCSGVSHIPASLPHDLDWLILSGNKISKLDETNTRFKSNLSKLNLSSNQIEWIPDAFLQQFTQLSSLDVSHNKLKSLPRILENMTSLSEIRISGNSFECYCQDTWITDWVVKNLEVIKDVHSEKCEMESGSRIEIKYASRVKMGCTDYQIPKWLAPGEKKYSYTV